MEFSFQGISTSFIPNWDKKLHIENEVFLNH